MPVEQALTVVAQTCREPAHVSRQDRRHARRSIERGESLLRAAIATGVFTPVVLQMIAVGEETGAVDELMQEVAHLYSNDVAVRAQDPGPADRAHPDRVPGCAGAHPGLGGLPADLGPGSGLLQAMKGRHGAVQLEWGVLLVILGVLAAVLLTRLQDVITEARRVQLRLGVEAVRSNAMLLLWRCPGAEDWACVQQALAGAQRVGADAKARPEAHGLARVGRRPSFAGHCGGGRTDAASGPGTQWQWQTQGPNRLMLSLQGVTECQFLLRWDLKSGAAVVEDVLDRC